MTPQKSILNFWHDVEVFNIPRPPSSKDQGADSKVTTLRRGQRLPWDNPAFRGNEIYTWVHAVYLGVADTQDLARAILAAVNAGDLNKDEREGRLSGQGCLAGFLVNEQGQVLKETYVRASFGFAVGLLKANQSLSGISRALHALAEGFDERTHAVAPPARNEALWLTQDEQAYRLDWAKLIQELDGVAAPLADCLQIADLRIVVKSTRRKMPKKDDERLEATLDFLNSFYIDDLSRLADLSASGVTFGPALDTYLGEATRPDARIDVLQNPSAMHTLLDPAHLPLGRWPSSSDNSLYMAQQAAVFSTCHALNTSGGLVAVNGPPGTGKTTLLFDVIAHVVVERANRIAACDQPEDVFLAACTAGEDIYYPIDPVVIGESGIVVASNNNAAVENITRDLPTQDAICSSEFTDAGYFQRVAANVSLSAKVKKEAWGLVSAALGSMSNRNKFARALFDPYEKPPKEDDAEEATLPCSMKRLLTTSLSEQRFWHDQWLLVRDRFKSRYATLVALREQLAKLDQALIQMDQLKANLDDKRRQLMASAEARCLLQASWAARKAHAEHRCQEVAQQLNQARHEKALASLSLIAATDRIENAESQVRTSRWQGRLSKWPGYRRQQHGIGQDAAAYARTVRAEAALALRSATQAEFLALNEHNDAQSSLAQVCKAIAAEEARLGQQYHALCDEVFQAERALASANSDIQQAQARDICLPDDAFWQKSNEQRHLSSIWVTRELEQLRSQCFLDALLLHEVTLLACAPMALANFRAVATMLSEPQLAPVYDKRLPQLWDILFFAVPVVSTTLASVSRLFAGMPPQGLGWLLLDEAGQATPQAAAGIFWRAKRAVVIGDPLQIAPVVTVPAALVTKLREKHGVDTSWSPTTASVQTVADRTMQYGTWIGMPADKDAIWTGLPLRAHRRCIDPMFKIANRIAYQNQMIQAVSDPPDFDCVLGPSQWFDVLGQTADHQVVREELIELKTQLRRLKGEWPHYNDGPASVFIISPFKKVAIACNRAIAALALGGEPWHVTAGTVHTFQGKQADIVFIVLGSAPGRAGAGSRDWASKTPNLLNVALTRAKRRVYIIGNKADWRRCSYYRELVEELER